jgi:hypothetical protein
VFVWIVVLVITLVATVLNGEICLGGSCLDYTLLLRLEMQKHLLHLQAGQ